MNFIFPYFGEIEQTEDVVQDTMIKLYEKTLLWEIANFHMVVHGAKNLANTELRKRNRKNNLFESNVYKTVSMKFQTFKKI